MLNVVRYSGKSESGQRLVLVHGFTQNAAVWAPMAEQLQNQFEVLAVDLPGHGETDPGHDEADLGLAADLLIDACGPAIYAGYSLGARVVLHAALRHGAEVQSAILIGAKAGFRQEVERHARHTADTILADRIDGAGETGLASFIDDWLAQSFNADLSPAAQFRAARLRNRAHGLAESLRRCGSGTQQPLWGQLASLDMPILLVEGQNDLPTVVSDNAEMNDAIGVNASLLVVDGVGHAGPFEAPHRYADVIATFLAHKP